MCSNHIVIACHCMIQYLQNYFDKPAFTLEGLSFATL